MSGADCKVESKSQKVNCNLMCISTMAVLWLLRQKTDGAYWDGKGVPSIIVYHYHHITHLMTISSVFWRAFIFKNSFYKVSSFTE
jgi:hypothetical protein